MIQKLIKDIESVISPIYLVGGSVRDILLGITPKDYDFATPLKPDEVESRVREAGKRPYLTGKRFGTVGFKYEGHFIEVTTFRSETYGATRRPAVHYVSGITEDLSRRDFTINAIALRGKRYIDPFGGRSDLEARLVRCVGNPALRFNEDPLRMLRAARFVAQLDFTLEGTTRRAISHHAFKITKVSHERWMEELDKILLSDHPENGLAVLVETDLLKFLVPELRLQIEYDQNSPYHHLNLWEHSVSTMRLVPKDPILRWAALLHDVGKPFTRINKRDRSNYPYHELVGEALVVGIAKRLKWSNERTHAVSSLVGGHMSDENSPLARADGLST